MKARAVPNLPKGTKADSPLFQIWLEQLRQAVPYTQTYSQILYPSSVPDGGNEQSFVVKGLVVGDIVTVNKPSYQAGLGIVNARVSATNTLSIQYSNKTGSPITPKSETYLIVATRL